MALDPTINFGDVSVSIGYDDAATVVVLASGEGAKLPSTFSYNLVWWDATTYDAPSEDINREIVRVTARSTDTLTITRAQESTSATAKNSAGKTYKMGMAITKKMIDDINLALTTSAGLRAQMTDETGTGALCFATSPTFTTDITVPLIIGGTSSAGNLLLQSTSHATKGLIALGSITNGLIYDAENRRVTLGGDETTMTVGGVTKANSFSTHITGGSQDYTWVSHVHSNSVGPVIAGSRSRGSEASPSTVSDGDNLLDLLALGYDGTDYETACAIHLDVDGNPSNNDMPGKIKFLTTPSGSRTLVDRMIIDQAGFVGINTTIPSSLLHIDDGNQGSLPSIDASTTLLLSSATASFSLVCAANQSSNIAFGDPDDENAGLIQYLHSANSLSFRTNSSGVDLMIDSSGNVGIGTVSPEALLHVGQTTGSGVNVYSLSGKKFGVVEGNVTFITEEITGDTQDRTGLELLLGYEQAFIDGSISIDFNSRDRGNNTDGVIAKIKAFKNGAAVNAGDGSLIFETAADGAASTTERMRIDSSGNVGIGITNPSQLLHVDGGQVLFSGGLGIGATPSVQASIVFGERTTTSPLAGTFALYRNAAGYFAFTTGTKQEVMKITDPGNVELDATTGALVVNRMTTTQRDALTPINGMVIYNTTTTVFNFYENGSWVTK